MAFLYKVKAQSGQRSGMKTALLAGLALLWLGGCVPSRQLAEATQIAPPAAYLSAGDTSTRLIERRFLFTDSMLVQLIDEAVLHNTDLLQATQRVAVARARLRYRKGALFPVVGADAAAGATRYGAYTMEGVGNFDTNLSPNIDEDQKTPVPLTPDFFLGLRSSWEIDLWGKLRKQREAAFMRVLASDQGRQLVLTTLVAEVASRYYELLSLDAELEVIRNNIRLQESALELSKVQQQGGRATLLAVQQFEAQLLRTRSLEAQNQMQMARVERDINFLAGRFPQPVRRSSGLLQQELPASVSAGIPAHMLRSRPDVAQAMMELRAASADVAAAQASFLPSLTITPYAGLHAFKAALLFDPASLALGVLGSLSMPLINRSALMSAYEQAGAEHQQSFHAYRGVMLKAYQEVETALAALQHQKKAYELNLQEAGILSDAIETANELYLAGYASYLEVITAQKSAIEAELNLINNKKSLFFSLIELYRSVGGGWK